MKRIYLFLLCFALLFIFAGCRNNDPVIAPSENTEPTKTTVSNPTDPAEETRPSQSTEAIKQQPMFSVFVPASTQEFTAADGTVIFRNTYQDMKLIMPDPDVASKIIIDFLNRVDNTGIQSADLLAAAGSDYTANPSWLAYSQSTIYSPERIDQSILSLSGSSITYAGSSHPTHVSVSANYDMVTGNFLTLGDILTEQSVCAQLYDLLIQELEQKKSEKQLYPYYKSIVQDILFSDPNSCINWYFTWDGICFYFSPYEIAPYVSGIINVHIPYSELLGIIMDAYFPPEYSNAGTVEAVLFTEADIADFTQICEVSESTGETILLHSGKSAVSHVTLSSGIFTSVGISTMPNYTIFACSTLTPGDAILLETDIPDTIPNLQLQYLSGDEYVTKYISQSGKDGSILLID